MIANFSLLLFLHREDTFARACRVHTASKQMVTAIAIASGLNLPPTLRCKVFPLPRLDLPPGLGT